MQKSLAEILDEVIEQQQRVDKVKVLQKYNSKELRNVLLLMYGKGRFNILLPKTVPPYKAATEHDNPGVWKREMRKLPYFVEGMGHDDLHKIKRENIFINMLETVHPKDAEYLVKMSKQETLKGITVKAINEAYGDIIPEETTNGQKEQE